ncbi:hypothetical protein O988_07371 [Pseudogymnoascus sp. VKM F-3808]|nr:hypothetical protein O988_07371 [Pseudogymnoascus sp. VKM F-3808]
MLASTDLWSLFSRASLAHTVRAEYNLHHSAARLWPSPLAETMRHTTLASIDVCQWHDPSASSAPPKPEGKLFQINNICKDEEARAVDAGWFCA